MERAGRWGILLAALALGAAARAEVRPARRLLQGAWTPDDVGLLDPSGISARTGTTFDLRLLEAIGLRAGIGFVLQPRERAGVHAALAQGEIDFALPEISTGKDDPATVLSESYRERSDLLFLASAVPDPPGTGPAILEAALAKGLRIGVTRDEDFGDRVDAILAEPRFAAHLSRAPRELDNLDRLLAGELDGFLSPRLAGLAALTDRPGSTAAVRPVPAPVAVHTLHIQFSRARVDPDTLAAVDQALRSLQTDGTERALRVQANAPVLLRLAAEGQWFHLLDLLGTVAFALSGVLLARREGYSVVGAFVLAALPAVGGGMVEDLIVGRRPIGVVASPNALLLVGATVVASYLLLRLAAAPGPRTSRLKAWIEDPSETSSLLAFQNLFQMTDALGLAAFTVLGVINAVRQWVQPLWMWGPFCAALSGAGGGILRDVVRVDSRNPSLRTSVYVEICLVWGLILSSTVDWLGREERPELLHLAVLLTVVGAFLTRMAAVRFRLTSAVF